MTRRIVARTALFVALLAAIAVAFLQHGWLDAAALRSRIAATGTFAPLLFMATYAATAVLFLPGAMLSLAGGALFGPVWGTLYSLTGATVGATIAFLIARYLASDWIHRRAGGWTKQLIQGVEQEGWRFVAFVRLVPLFPFNMLNYALGLTRIGLLAYVVGTYVFMLPGALAYNYIGYAGREAAYGGQGLIHKGLMAITLIGIAAFLPNLLKRLRAKPDVPTGTISSAELKQRLDRNEELPVLDVRSVADFTGDLGHIAGSINIPFDDLPQRLLELEPRREYPLAVICRTNRMSGKAVELLRAAGFTQALLVGDGMVGWKRHGFGVAVEGTAAGFDTRSNGTARLQKRGKSDDRAGLGQKAD